MGVRMNFVAVLLVIIVTVFTAACTQRAAVCSPPYAVHGNTCCLDRDNNTVCDKDENASLAAGSSNGGFDCKLCPPNFVTQKEEVIRYKYVCYNQTVVDDAKQCGVVVMSDAKQFLIDDSQDENYIKTFDSGTACRGANPAAELKIVFNQVPQNITLQYKDDPKGGYTDLSTVIPKENQFYYVGFCSDGCGILADASLAPNDVYALRLVLQYPDRKVYSKEILIDVTAQGAYGKKSCS